MKRILFMVLGSLFAVGFAFADDLTTAVVGRWTAEGKALEFYGQAIGRSIAETPRYFKYDFPADGQITLNFGGGSTEPCAISITNNELHITDAGQQETVYTKVETNLNPCVQNLRQLDGAMALFALDHPSTEPEAGEGMNVIGFGDLVPAYLPSLPVCPDGGMYDLTGANGHPACNITGHSLDQ